MESWIEEVYDTPVDGHARTLGELILDEEVGRKFVSETTGLSMWKARQAISAIREERSATSNTKSNSRSESRPEFDLDRSYWYDPNTEHYVFSIPSHPQGPYLVPREKVQKWVRAYSNYDGDGATINQIATASEIPRDVFVDIKQALGLTHDSPPRTEEELREGTISELVAEDIERIKYDYAVRLQAEKMKQAQRDAKKWRKRELETKRLFDAQREALESATYTVPKLDPLSEERAALVLNLQDLHIGHRPFDDSFTLAEYVEQLTVSFERLLRKARRAAHVDRVFVIVGADLVDVDTFERTTTNGTPQHTLAQPRDLLLVAQEFMVGLVDRARQIAPDVTVELLRVEGNHDRLLHVAVYTYLEAWYRHAEDVICSDEAGTRQHRAYGLHHIVGMHGDLPKSRWKVLPQVVMGEARGLATATRYTTVFCGHLHHEQISIDLAGIKVVQSPYPGQANEWADTKMYTGSRRGLHGSLLFAESPDDSLITVGVG